MDDFERGAREMQRVAAEALDDLVKQTEAEMRSISRGLDHARTWGNLQRMMQHYRYAAALVRSIKIQDTVSG